MDYSIVQKILPKVRDSGGEVLDILVETKNYKGWIMGNQYDDYKINKTLDMVFIVLILKNKLNDGLYLKKGDYVVLHKLLQL